MSERPTLGGLPIDRWVGRQIRLTSRNEGVGKSCVNGVLKGLTSSGRRGEVKLANHRGSELIDIKDMRPWWSKNPDLQDEAKRLKSDE